VEILSRLVGGDAWAASAGDRFRKAQNRIRTQLSTDVQGGAETWTNIDACGNGAMSMKEPGENAARPTTGQAQTTNAPRHLPRALIPGR